MIPLGPAIYCLVRQGSGDCFRPPPETASVLKPTKSPRPNPGEGGYLGGARGNRTPDPLTASQVLSHLSYGPNSVHFTYLIGDCQRQSRGSGNSPLKGQTAACSPQIQTKRLRRCRVVLAPRWQGVVRQGLGLIASERRKLLSKKGLTRIVSGNNLLVGRLLEFLRY